MQSQSVHEMEPVPDTKKVATHMEAWAYLRAAEKAIQRAMECVHPFEPTPDQLDLAGDHIRQAWSMLGPASELLGVDTGSLPEDMEDNINSGRTLYIEVSNSGDIHVSTRPAAKGA